jgi:hypothetical protein
MADAYISPTPETELTTRDRLEIKYLDAASPKEFDSAVSVWVENDPDGSGTRVFYSAALVNRTYEALGRLMGTAQARRKKSSGIKAQHLDERIERIAQHRHRAKEVRKTVLDGERSASPRQRALGLLAELYPDVASRLRRELSNGRDPQELLAQMRGELQHAEGHP